jgi:ATP-dependent RNA helicase MSS116
VNPGKVVVFVPANTHVAIYAQLFRYLAPRRISYQVHSQLSQSDRTKVYNRFCKSRDGILVSSDLSAYGVHYPNVSLVIQIGVPDSRERYIQRLGQTNGESVLVLAPFEDRFVTNEIADLPVEILDPPGLENGQSAVVLYATHYVSKSANDEAMDKLFAGYVKYCK